MKQGTEKRTFSAPKKLIDHADSRVRSGLFPTFSSYIQALLKKDFSGKSEQAHKEKRETATA